MSDFSLFVEDGEDLMIFSVLSDMRLTSYDKDRPSSLSFSILSVDKKYLTLGKSLVLAYKGAVFFKGFIFTITEKNFETITVTAFDQIRYLKNKETYVYHQLTATAFIEQVARDFSLQTGTLFDTAYIIPYRILEEKTLLDMIYDSLELTFLATGNTYCFFDQGGKLSLQPTKNLIMNLWLDRESISSTEHLQTIENSYNAVKLTRIDDRSGFKEIHYVEDKTLQKAFGHLQYHQRIPVKTESPQAFAKHLLEKSKNMEERLSIKQALGIPLLQGGASLYVGKEGKLMTVKKVIHTISENHLMDLELVDYGYG